MYISLYSLLNPTVSDIEPNLIRKLWSPLSIIKTAVDSRPRSFHQKHTLPIRTGRNMRIRCLIHYSSFFFFSPGATTPIGVVFYSPLVGFSLLAYEVS